MPATPHTFAAPASTNSPPTAATATPKRRVNTAAHWPHTTTPTLRRLASAPRDAQWALSLAHGTAHGCFLLLATLLPPLVALRPPSKAMIFERRDGTTLHVSRCHHVLAAQTPRALDREAEVLRMVSISSPLSSIRLSTSATTTRGSTADTGRYKLIIGEKYIPVVFWMVEAAAEVKVHGAPYTKVEVVIT
ncbi:hypothetical protein GGX14DRAFT_397213 [Mycena pura]|uniref:Uncharacterized protein n=1 Tax=Mycena pura TaxID=153505 RepID=A0AAD6VD32_9AGAR|nr:hypothetical protein GGX14DRAFT_397213 [Mycena pura]